VSAAVEKRRPLLAQLEAEGTDCVRLFHGSAEGRPGVAVDRYGDALLVQSWREPLGRAELLEVAAAAGVEPLSLAYHWRGRRSGEDAGAAAALEEELRPRAGTFREGGLEFGFVPPRERGDPSLFLDLRAGRRFVREWVRARVAGEPPPSVLNAFAFTCGAGVCAAAEGARVLNLDIGAAYLADGERNAALNGVAERMEYLCEDWTPAARQLAGLAVKGRAVKRRKSFRKLEPRTFHLVVLDPPTFTKGPFGAIDIERDYASLAKPAFLMAQPGEAAVVLATNHSPKVGLEEWLDQMQRCAAKCGRRLSGDPTIVAGDADFPSFDGRPPLKVAAFPLA